MPFSPRLKHTVISLQVLLLFFATGYQVVEAGFGITPPYVRNTSLTRNSIYEQQILMVRGNPDTGQIAEVTLDAPEIDGWIEIVEGNRVPLPKGIQKVPLTVRVTVPGNADFKDYNGLIRIRTVPDTDSVAAGAVSISLGARIDVNLSIIDRVIEDFRVRRISVSDLNEGSKVAWLYFPGKISFAMLLENTGNVNVSPSKVELRIFNRAGDTLLEETTHIGRINKIAPYATEEVVASIPTRLPAGSYVARYRIFNGDDVKQEGDLSLSILPAGTLQTAGFGFIGLSAAHKISLILPIAILLLTVMIMVWQRRKRRTI